MTGVGQLRDGDSLDYLELKYLTWQNHFSTYSITSERFDNEAKFTLNCRLW
ncbi:MAG: hypothetical protein ACJAYG_002879 [Oceanicoccus sp.]|jgi:hypothetical protein